MDVLPRNTGSLRDGFQPVSLFSLCPSLLKAERLASLCRRALGIVGMIISTRAQISSRSLRAHVVSLIERHSETLYLYWYHHAVTLRGFQQPDV